ncbi:MAG: HIT family protein [Polyangiales bacterium]
MSDSPFLARPRDEWLAENELAFAIPDGYPVTPGHALVVPKRVVTTWFEASREERDAIVEGSQRRGVTQTPTRQRSRRLRPRRRRRRAFGASPGRRRAA